MTAERSVRIEMELRVTYPAEPGKLAGILKILRREGGRLYGHLVYRLEDAMMGLFVCEKPTAAALALERQGIAVETETAVLALAENRPGALSHLVEALEAEGIRIAYSYATSRGEELFVVFRTEDNPKVEDILRNYLSFPDFTER